MTLCNILMIILFISNRWSCAIPDPDNEEVIITGGGYPARSIVSVYSEAGWQRDLASFKQERYHHACGSYVNGGKKVNHIVLYQLFDKYIQLPVSYYIWRDS